MPLSVQLMGNNIQLEKLLDQKENQQVQIFLVKDKNNLVDRLFVKLIPLNHKKNLKNRLFLLKRQLMDNNIQQEMEFQLNFQKDRNFL